jgi:hypothetical protein
LGVWDMLGGKDFAFFERGLGKGCGVEEGKGGGNAEDHQCFC